MRKITKNSIATLISAIALLGSVISCGGFVDYSEHTNPYDAIYDSNVNGEIIRIVLSNPQKIKTQEHLIQWSKPISGTEFDVNTTVLYQKNGTINDAEITALKENSMTLSGSFSVVSKETPQSAKLLNFSGVKTFVVGMPHPYVSGKTAYSNVIIYDFNQ